MARVKNNRPRIETAKLRPRSRYNFALWTSVSSINKPIVIRNFPENCSFSRSKRLRNPPLVRWLTISHRMTARAMEMHRSRNLYLSFATLGKNVTRRLTHSTVLSNVIQNQNQSSTSQTFFLPSISRSDFFFFFFGIEKNLEILEI